jgi:hypothetical protein
VGEITHEIEREIRDKRQDLGRNLNELEDKARELADWRSHYRNHSGVFLGAAFAAGAIAAMATVPASSGGPRLHALSDADTSHDPYATRHSHPGPRNATFARVAREVNETWGQIADALLRTASVRALQFVSELVPGVREQFESGRSHDPSTRHDPSMR